MKDKYQYGNIDDVKVGDVVAFVGFKSQSNYAVEPEKGKGYPVTEVMGEECFCYLLDSIWWVARDEVVSVNLPIKTIVTK